MVRYRTPNSCDARSSRVRPVKVCPRCKVNKSLDEFSPNLSRKDGRQGACIPCMREYRKEHYRNNKAPYLRRAKDQIKLERPLLIKWYDEYKSTLECVDCGISYPGEPYLMEFDHQHSKTANVSRLVNYSKGRLLREIAKCEPVCVVCHRRRTFKGRSRYA